MFSKLRTVVSPVQNALATPFVRLGVEPATLTLAAIPLSLLSGFLCVWEFWSWGLALALLALTMDFLDGAVARVANKTSAFGNFLDAVADRLVEGFLLCGLAYHFPVAATTALTLSVTVSYIKARAGLVVISDNRDWPGVGDRTDRVALVLLAIWVQSQGMHLLGLPAGALVLWALALLAGVGCYQRICYGKELIELAEEEGQLLPYLADSSITRLTSS